MDPQNCTKCNALPEDILMLACSHDLCLNCAADRLAFEMKKKKNANVTHPSRRALSASSATSARPSTPKVSANSKDSSPPPSSQPGPMRSPPPLTTSPRPKPNTSPKPGLTFRTKKQRPEHTTGLGEPTGRM